MANLNTDTSVVDYLKSTGGDSSYTGRAKKAVELGIVKSTGDYLGSEQQNVSLLAKLKAGVPAAPSNVSSMQDATSFINSKQDEDIAAADKLDEPPTRNAAEDLVGAFKDLTGKSSLVPQNQLPTAPDFTATFEQLRGKYNVSQIEQSINDFDAEEQDLQAQLRISKNEELGKPVALGVISGRVGEQERNMMERIDFVQRQKSRAVSQLQTANDAIENLMTFKKMDYDVAKDQYDTEFSQNITLFNTIKGVAEFASSEKEREQDNARSNLQIIYNAVQDGEADLSTIDAGTQAKIGKLELQAGLPQGFYKSIQTAKPEAKVLSTTTRSTGGKKYADVLYQNKDGSLTTSQVYLGVSSEGEGGSESDIERENRAKIVSYFDGLGGNATADQYKAARKAWVADVKGATPSEFDDIFARDYLDESEYDAAGVSLF